MRRGRLKSRRQSQILAYLSVLASGLNLEQRLYLGGYTQSLLPTAQIRAPTKVPVVVAQRYPHTTNPPCNALIFVGRVSCCVLLATVWPSASTLGFLDMTMVILPALPCFLERRPAGRRNGWAPRDRIGQRGHVRGQTDSPAKGPLSSDY
jgi:hypothetical protein